MFSYPTSLLGLLSSESLSSVCYITLVNKHNMFLAWQQDRGYADH